MHIPSDIQVTLDGIPAGPPFSFTSFVRYLLDGDSRANATGAAIRAAARIERAIEEGKDLEPNDAKLLSEIADAPEHGYPFLVGQQGGESIKRPIGRQLAPFIDACLGAVVQSNVDAPAPPAPPLVA